jgi:hypothetical protein
MIRVYGGNRMNGNVYTFDFVNSERQCICIPNDVKLYGLEPDYPADYVDGEPDNEDSDEEFLEDAAVQVPPLENGFDYLQTPLRSLQYRTAVRDASLNTYVLREGSIIRITQQNYPDQYLFIPVQLGAESPAEVSFKSHISKDAVLALQPW